MEQAVPPRVEDLLVHAGLVRSVARAVLHGDDRVEDVVQDTWVASIQSGPRDASVGPGWLARVSRRLAGTVRRRDATRHRREAAAARLDSLPSTAEIASREETRRRVVDALLHIEEPFRSALLLRYYEGAAPRVIAARMGVPVETARSRVRRGLEQLRARLIGGRDAERERRHLALLAVLPTSWTTASLLGGLLVTHKLIAAAAALVLLLLGGGVWLVVTGDGSGMGVDLPRRDVALETVPEPRLAAAARPSAPPGMTEPTSDLTVSKPMAQRDTVLRGSLLGFDPSLPGQATVVVTGIYEWSDAPREPIPAVARQDGSFELDVSALTAAPSAKELSVLVDHPAYMRAVSRVRLETPDALRILVVMTRAGALIGRVVNESGAPVPGATLGLLPEGELGQSASSVDAVRTDSDGTYRLRAARDGAYRIVADAPGLRPAWRTERLQVGAVRELPPLALERGAEISGSATAPWLGAARLEVDARPERLGSSIVLRAIDGSSLTTLTSDGELLQKEDARAPVGSTGEFRIGGLVPGPHLVRADPADTADGTPAPNVHQDLIAKLEQRVDAPSRGLSLHLQGAVLVVELAGPVGPVGKGRVEVSGFDETEDDLSTGIYGMSTGEDGRARILVRPERPYRIAVRADGFAAAQRTVRAPAMGLELVERVDLERPKAPARILVLRLATESEEDPGIAKIRVQLLPLVGEGDSGDWTVAKEEEGFRFEDPPAGRHRLRVQSAACGILGGATPYLDVEQVVDISEHGESRVTVRVALGGWLVLTAKASDGRVLPARCRVLDGAGASRARYFMVRDQGGGHGGSGALDDADPAQVEPPLAPGTYTVELEAEGFGPRRVETGVRRGETTTLEVTMQPQ